MTLLYGGYSSATRARRRRRNSVRTGKARGNSNKSVSAKAKAKAKARANYESRLTNRLSTLKTRSNNSKTRSRSKSSSDPSEEGELPLHISPEIHRLYYLNHLHRERFDYPGEGQYPRGKPIPFNKIDKFVAEDMKTQYLDEPPDDFGWDDSGSWYEDKKDLKVGDVILDDQQVISRSHVEAWLVVRKKKNKCLVMFPMSDGDPKNGFGDGDTTNGNGLWIHPVTKKLVHINGT